MDNLKIKKFGDVNFADSFFDSLKKDYNGFISWSNKKCKTEDTVFVLYNKSLTNVEGFMYLKEEISADDVIPPLTGGPYLKVGTFKFNSIGTLRGERFIKKIFDVAVARNITKIYVTVFEKHQYLIKLFERYGFSLYGIKNSLNGEEKVLLKTTNLIGDLEKDYPYVNTNTNKYLLAIYPEYHTQLFPDSILKTETTSIINDTSHTNSIHKVYITKIPMIRSLKKGDILVIYRTKERGKPAHYSSVATSICAVEEIKTLSSFSNENEFIDYCNKYSVFSTNQLVEWFNERHCYVIKFTYNIALPKRTTRAKLIENVGISPDLRWSCIPLDDNQFRKILELGEVNENFIINKT